MLRSLVGILGRTARPRLSAMVFSALMLWSFAAHGSTLKWKASVWGAVQASLTVGTDGTVYAVTGNNVLYALDSNGAQRWRYDGTWNVTGTPTIGPDGTIYMGSANDDRLYAITAAGGERWEFQTTGNTYHTPAVGPDGTIYVASGDTQSNGGTFYAVNPDGTQQWSYHFADATFPKTSPAIGPDGTIYVGFKHTQGGNRLHAFNSDGSLKWTSQAQIFDISASPAIGADGTIYLGSAGDGVFAINPLDGSTNWNLRGINQYHSSPAVGEDGTIYIGSTDNKLYAINPNGTVKWSYLTGDDVNAGPSIAADGTIYAGSFDDKLYAVRPGGSLRWSYDTGTSLLACPAIAADGTVYVASYDGSGSNYVYAVNGTGSGLATDAPWPTFGHDSQHTGNVGVTVPGPISPVNNQVVQGTLVAFRWNTAGSGVTYRFQLANNPALDQAFSQDVTVTGIAFTNQAFTAGHQYFWRVGLVSGSADPVFSPVQSFVYGSPLAHPLLLAPAYGQAVTSPVGFAWSFPGAAQFGLQVATDAGFTQLLFSNYVTVTSGTLNLPPGGTYYWRVAPFDSNQNAIGIWSDTYMFTTTP